MAQKDKTGRIFFEVTKDRPATTFEVFMSTASIGAILGFFASLLAGSVSRGTTLDDIILYCMISTVLGFGIGLLGGWLFLKYFGNLLSAGFWEKKESPVRSSPGPSEGPEAGESVLEGEGAKGKSVDYVFPEFSPDQR